MVSTEAVTLTSDPCSMSMAGEEPDFNTALEYVAAVKKRFAHAPRVYQEFLYTLRSFRDGALTRSAVCEAIGALFADEQDLLRGFSIFLPDEEQPQLYTHACAAKLTATCTLR